jgi:hypothetical protein
MSKTSTSKNGDGYSGSKEAGCKEENKGRTLSVISQVISKTNGQ